MNRDGLGLELVGILQIVDKPEPALWRDQLSNLGGVGVGLCRREHEGRRSNTEGGDLRRASLLTGRHAQRLPKAAFKSGCAEESRQGC